MCNIHMILNNKQKIFIDRVTDDCILSDDKFTKVHNFLIINNYELIDNHLVSDVIILDICWFKKNFLDQTGKKIDLYLGLNKTVILFWCISAIFREKYWESLIYVNSKNFSEVEGYFEHKIWILETDSLSFKNKLTILETGAYRNYSATLNDFDKIWFVSISNWCSLSCSYCNIKKIKWNTLSSPLEQILGEISKKIEKWELHIYLLSDDCGSYGIDIWTDFADLLDRIFALNDNVKVYITNIYPLFFLKFYDRIKKYIFSDRIGSIVLPLQHTSERILSLMNRKYRIDKIIELLVEIKNSSNTQLLNHIIFDYHDETLEEFVDTLRLLPLYDKSIYIKYSDINNVFWEGMISNNLKRKITLLKKLEKKYTIDMVI